MVFAVLVAGTCLFHLAVVAGAPWGHLTMGGRWPGALPMPARVLPVLSALLLIWAARVVLAAAGLIAGPVAGWAAWLVLAILVVAVLANATTPSAPERRLWLPVTLAMLASGGAVLVPALMAG